jgi:hypothetical protein
MRTRTFNLFKNENKNLQPLRAKTKAFNLSESKSKNLQPPKEKTKVFNHLKNKNKNLNFQNKNKKPSISKLFK